MKIRPVLIGCVLACVLVFSPFHTRAQILGNDDAYRALLLELIEVLQQQIIALQAELESRQPAEPKVETIINSLGDSISVAAVYNIDDVSEVGRISNKENREYFTRVFELFPDEYDEKIKRLEVFSGDDAVFDAYVETIPPRHEYWMYSVNSEVVKDEDSDASTELIIHELAHIISYEERQGVSEITYGNCEDYFDIHGCPSENSYLRQFVDTFWSPSDLRRAEDFAEADDSYESAYEYYEMHEDEYVTDYAASSPEEDFADSFMFYVTGERVPFGTEVRDKVDWFKQFSKLVTIRREILINI